MRITTIGVGYVGLVIGVGLSKMGHEVTLVDIDSHKIELINQGKVPFYEQGVESILRDTLNNGLKATLSVEEAVRDTEVIFLCVQTSCDNNGVMDLSYIKRATEDVGKALKKMNTDHPVVVVKSTVLPGVTEDIVLPILEESSGKKCCTDFGIIVNPEFLREGQAMEDFLHPDRIVLGELDKRSGDIICELYKDFHTCILRVDLKTAEMIKYACNTFLATKISFINEVGNICKLMGIHVGEVVEGMKLDSRISPHFLQAGIGFGGSCLPKDIKAITACAKDLGYQPELFEGVLRVNEKQPLRLVRLAEAKAGNLHNKNVAILGLTFKAKTDDMREASSVVIIQELLQRGAQLSIYDPMAGERARAIFGDRVEYCCSAQEAVATADVVFILTEWDEFKDPSLYEGKKVFTGRMIFDTKPAQKLDCEGICW